MKHNRAFQAVAAGIALAALGMSLSGCEAKPGVAAASPIGEITEQELGQVSAELGQISMVDRATALQLLLALKHGGQEILDQCPKWEEIPVKDFKIPAGTKLSARTKDVMTLSLCQAAANPAVAQNLGVPVTSPNTAQALAGVLERVRNNPAVELSAREQTGLNLLQQQQQQAQQGQQGMATPQR